MFPFKQGFTLIELLIVMAIMSLSVALVIPLSVAQVDAAKQRAEREKVVVFLRQSALNAFYFSSTVNVAVLGKNITAQTADRDPLILQLQYVSFDEASLQFFAAGPANNERLTARLNGRTWQLEISREEISWSNVN